MRAIYGGIERHSREDMYYYVEESYKKIIRMILLEEKTKSTYMYM